MRANFQISLTNFLAARNTGSKATTDYGIELSTYRDFYGKGKKAIDLINITQEQLETIFRVHYWDKCMCDQLPYGLDYLMFNYAVQNGTEQAIKSLQQVIGAHVDCVMGNQTLSELKKQKIKDVIKAVYTSWGKYLGSSSTSLTILNQKLSHSTQIFETAFKMNRKD